MIVRTAVVVGLLGLLSGCGGVAPKKVKRAKPAHPGEIVVRHGANVRVTVIDGDTRRRVRGALVRIGHRGDYVNRRGVAHFGVARRGSLEVTVSARGYRTRTLRMPFRLRDGVVFRLYRPALQWPMYGADPARTQAQTGIRLRPPFRIVWSRGIGTLIEFPAVVSDGVAFIGNYRGTVRAVSMRTGEVAWRRDTPHGKMAASPAVWHGYVVAHGMDGHVWVLDRRNGRLVWHFAIGSPVESSPVIRDGIDYFGAWNGRVYALDLRRHRLRWSRGFGYKITSSAALAGKTLYIGDYAGRLLAIAPGNGSLRWSRSVNGRIYGTPAVSGRRVFVPSSDGASLTAFSTRGGRLWSVHTGAYVYSSPAVWAGRVFFGSYNGVFYCVSASSGRVLWEVGLGGAISGAAVVVDGIAYAGSFAHRIVGVNARSGRVVFRFPHGEYVPVSGNGGRLLLHGYSRLFAVEPRRRR